MSLTSFGAKYSKSNAHLNGQKKKHLEQIRNRELLNEQRTRLGQVIIQKLVSRYGSSSYNLIVSFVEDFFRSRTGSQIISNEEISNLEREIIEAISLNFKLPLKERSQLNHSSSEPVFTQSERDMFESSFNSPSLNPASSTMARPSTSHNSSTNDSLTALSSSYKHNLSSTLPNSSPISEWQIIQGYNLVLADEKEQKQQESNKLKKQSFKSALDQHMEIAKEKQRRMKMEEKNFCDTVLQDVSKHREDEWRKKEICYRINQEESESRRRQIEERNAQLRAEKEKARLDEERALKLNEELIEREKLVEIQARKKNLDFGVIIKNEYEDAIRRKAFEALKLGEEDRRLMQEYSARMDRDAEARESFFRKRMESLEKLLSKTSNKFNIKDQLNEEIRQEMDRIQRQKDLEDAAYRERERLQAEEKRNKERQVMIENERIRLMKRQIELEEKNRRDALGQQVVEQAESFLKAEEERKRQLRESQAQYRATLESQVQARKSIRDAQKTDFSETERCLNATTLKKVTEDPQMFSRVLHRIRLTSANGGSRPHTSAGLSLSTSALNNALSSSTSKFGFEHK